MELNYDKLFSPLLFLAPHCLRQFASVFLLVAGFAAVGGKAGNQLNSVGPPSAAGSPEWYDKLLYSIKKA